MHTSKLTDLAAPALEKAAPVLDRVTEHLPHQLPQGLTDHLPHQLADHLPGSDTGGPAARAGRFASGHKRGVLILGLLAALGAVAGWLVARRAAEPAWAPSHSGGPDARLPASGYAQGDHAATGSAGSAGGAADRGAEDGFGGAAIGGTAQVSEGPYGVGSAAPLEDGGSPGAAYTIKGESASRVFHTRDSATYDAATADVWFADAATARAAGFTAPDDE